MEGQTDVQTDERHTIIRPKFHFGHIHCNKYGIGVPIHSEVQVHSGRR